MRCTPFWVLKLSRSARGGDAAHKSDASSSVSKHLCRSSVARSSPASSVIPWASLGPSLETGLICAVTSKVCISASGGGSTPCSMLIRRLSRKRSSSSSTAPADTGSRSGAWEIGAVCCLMRCHFCARSEPAGNGQLSSMSSLRWILRREDGEEDRTWVLMGKHWPTASWIFWRSVRLLPDALLSVSSAGTRSESRDSLESFRRSPYLKPSLTGRAEARLCEAWLFFFPLTPFAPSCLSSERLWRTLGRAPRSLSFPRSPASSGRVMTAAVRIQTSAVRPESKHIHWTW